MLKSAWVLAAVLLALGVGFLAVARARDDDEKQKIKAAQAAAADVAKLADAVNDPVELKKLAQAMAKKYDDLEPFMWQMKPAEKGGVVIGKPGTWPNDSIELALLQMGKRPPTADQLAAQAADLQRMAEVICGIAEMPPYYGTTYTNSPKALDQWNARANDMRECGHELLTVVKSKDATAFKKAIIDLNHSCNECHTVFRDGPPLFEVEQAALAVNNPAKLKEHAANLARLYPLDKLSWTFRPRDKGGLGVGPQPGAAPDNSLPVFVPYPIGTKPRTTPTPAVVLPDGIEAALVGMANNPPTAARLAAQAKDLQHMAEVVRVIAEATPDYGKEYASTDDGRKKWSGFSDDMKQGSDDLIAAVKGNDVKALQKALDRLDKSCTDCHKAFR